MYTMGEKHVFSASDVGPWLSPDRWRAGYERWGTGPAYYGPVAFIPAGPSEDGWYWWRVVWDRIRPYQMGKERTLDAAKQEADVAVAALLATLNTPRFTSAHALLEHIHRVLAEPSSLSERESAMLSLVTAYFNQLR